MNIEDIKTVKQAIKLLNEYNIAIRSGQPTQLTVPEIFELNVKVFESLAFRIEDLERQIGLGPQFINMDDIPTRLR
jgi:hypothetical protein